jgi:hypothetical protein
MAQQEQHSILIYAVICGYLAGLTIDLELVQVLSAEANIMVKLLSDSFSRAA